MIVEVSDDGVRRIRCRECEELREIEDFTEDGLETEICRLCGELPLNCVEFIEQAPDVRLDHEGGIGWLENSYNG